MKPEPDYLAYFKAQAEYAKQGNEDAKLKQQNRFKHAWRRKKEALKRDGI